MLSNTMQVSESGLAPTPLFPVQFPSQPLGVPSNCPQTLGTNPRDTNSQLTAYWLRIGAHILTLGGSERMFDELTGPYAFVGGNTLPSHAGLPATCFDSSSYPTGSLAYGRNAVYYPASAAANAFAKSQLEQIVYQPPTPWPHSSTRAEQDALVYLTEQLDNRWLSGTDTRREHAGSRRPRSGLVTEILMDVPSSGVRT